MRTFTVWLMMCVAAVVLVACGGASFATPEDTATSFLKAAQAKNEDAMTACMAKKDREKGQKNKEGGNKDAEIVKWEIKGKETVADDKCIVKVSVTEKKEGKESTGEMPLFMIKEEGQWKISFVAMAEEMFKGLGDKFKEAMKDK